MKIKVGLCVGYDGTGYSGLQLNKDLNTIEKAISECLFECNAISKMNADKPSNIHLKSSSRTDKGVHAAYNLVCCKIEKEVSTELHECLKGSLSKRNIYLYKLIRLTKSFIPCKMVSTRVYEYVVPTYFLQEDVLCGDDSAKLIQRTKYLENKIHREYSKEDLNKLINYKSSKEGIEIFTNMCKGYIGTKSYHNYTVVSNPNGKSRYIKSVCVSNTYVEEGVEYIRITIEGQSFLLHQIRKMMYFCVLLTKYKRVGWESYFNKSFEKGVMHIPKGPGQYLMLDGPNFMEVRDKGKMVERLVIDEIEKQKYKLDVLYKCIHKKDNLKWFMAVLDSSRFYCDKLNYL